MDRTTKKGSRNGKPPAVAGLAGRRKLILFGWYGGKFSHLDWLLPLLPASHHYCEPFAGSAAVLLNRDPSPIETYNDLDGEVANFFRVLRDHGEELTCAIGLTPFSREEFALACKLDPSATPLERARRFYVRARQVRTGLAQTASLGRWANCKNTSRAGMSGVVSRWLGGVEMLPHIAERLLRVQIENRPAIDVIRLYDSRNTLFYCDPPYVHATRGGFESLSPRDDGRPASGIGEGPQSRQRVGGVLELRLQTARRTLPCAELEKVPQRSPHESRHQGQARGSAVDELRTIAVPKN